MRQSNTYESYSRNKLINTKLLKQLVDRSGIDRRDTVYDIGAGSGNISKALLGTGARVIAIEKEPAIAGKCQAMIVDEDRFELYIDDFLQMSFPPEGSYKVFSNIPFIYTAQIIGKLLNNSNPPESCYLIVQKEAAEKYAGIRGETLQSLLLKPVFWVDIIYYFDRRDFQPVPGVDIVMIQFEKRRCRLVPEEHYQLYRDFVIFCRDETGMTVKGSLLRLFTWNQLRKISSLLAIDHRRNVTDLTYNQYLAMFQFYLECYRNHKVSSVAGAEEVYNLKHKNRRNRVF